MATAQAPDIRNYVRLNMKLPAKLHKLFKIAVIEDESNIQVKVKELIRNFLRGRKEEAPPPVKRRARR